MWKKDKSVQLSMQKPIILHGVTLRKLPFGKYAQALNMLEGLVGDIGKKVFPGLPPEAVLEHLKRADLSMLWNIVINAPEAVAELLEALLDIPKARVMDPNAEDGLSPAELVEIINTAWSLNDLSGFLKGAKGLMNSIRDR